MVFTSSVSSPGRQGLLRSLLVAERDHLQLFFLLNGNTIPQVQEKKRGKCHFIVVTREGNFLDANRLNNFI